MPTNFPTSATLTGAIRVSRMSMTTRQEDLGYKVERLISVVNDMQSSFTNNASAVARLNSAILQTNATVSSIISTISAINGVFCNISAATLSSLPIATASVVLASLSNFRA